MEKMSDLLDQKLFNEHDKVVTRRPAFACHEVQGTGCTLLVLACTAPAMVLCNHNKYCSLHGVNHSWFLNYRSVIANMCLVQSAVLWHFAIF